MGLLKFKTTLTVPKTLVNASVDDLVERLFQALAKMRVQKVERDQGLLFFQGLHLNRQDLVPVPEGWIRVAEASEAFQVTCVADYTWRRNRTGRFAALAVTLILVMVTLMQAILDGPVPLQFFGRMAILIPLLVAFFWYFVYGVNCLYSRIFMTKWLRLWLIPQGGI